MNTKPDTMSHVEALEAIGYRPTVSWVCGVVRSGFHNGAGCRHTDPHGHGWNCSWRVEVSIPVTDEEAAVAVGMLR